MTSFNLFATKIADALNLKKCGATEYAGPCPVCGGTDRFRINEHKGELKHHCRKECDMAERTNELQRRGLLPEWTMRTEPYHISKRLPLTGAELQGDDVVVPLYNISTGERVGKQTIKPNGKKFFSKGLRKRNTGAFIGEASDVLYVCEGWATAVAVHKSTSKQTLFALDSNNLPNLVNAIKNRNIIIASDNDPEGVKAAEASGKPWVMPAQDGDDWWDVWNRDGADAVRSALSATDTATINPLEGFAITTGLSLIQKQFSPLVWLKEDLIPTPNLVLIAGAPKCGKSWYALSLARDLVTDGYKTFYIANEDTEQRLKARYKKVSVFPNELLIFLSGLSSEKPLPRGDAAITFLRALKALYADLRCIIIDTIQGIRDHSIKQDYGSVEVELSKLRKLAHELEITIVVVHHTRKQTDFETAALDSILGSTAIGATVETILMMQRVSHSKDVDLFITGKDVEERADYRLVWTDRGFNDPIEKRFADLGHFQKSVFDYVNAHPRCTQASIVEALGKSKQQVNEAVKRLIEVDLMYSGDGGRLFCTQSK